MEKLQICAHPWWVNLLALIPFITYAAFRRKRALLNWRQLTTLAIFAASFGFVEAAVVVYLRAANRTVAGIYRNAVRASAFVDGLSSGPVYISISPEPAHHRGLPRSGHHDHAGECDAARGIERKCAMGRLSMAFCFVGYRLLCRTLAHGSLARFTHRSGCVVSHPSALDFAGLVSLIGEWIHGSSNCVIP